MGPAPRLEPGGTGATSPNEPLRDALQYLPFRHLASPACLQQLAELRKGRDSTSSCEGAALFLDVRGFSSFARSFTNSDGAAASENLTSALNEYFSLLVRFLHAREASVLFFAGDAVVAFVPAAGRTLPEAVALAARAALDVQGIRFARAGYSLVVHTGLGAGLLETHLISGGERSAHAVFSGDVIRQVCEAQRASSGDQIVASPEAHALLPPSFPSRPHGSSFLLLPGGTSPPLSPSPPSSVGPLCGCGAPIPAGSTPAAAALAPYAPAAISLVPEFAAGGDWRETGLLLTNSAFWTNQIRTVYVVFASFPDIDVGIPSSANADRFGEVARSVHAAAQQYGAAVNKLWLDDKGASALLGFGLPGGFSHEDDASRAVQAALALEESFAEEGAPLACGVAGGRAFVGILGAPCRKEYAVIGDCVILAARLMGAAKADSGKGAEARRVLVDAGVVAAVQDGRRTATVRFEEMPAVHAKGFDKPVRVFRPQRKAPEEGTAGSVSGDSASSRPHSFEFRRSFTSAAATPALAPASMAVPVPLVVSAAATLPPAFSSSSAEGSPLAPGTPKVLSSRLLSLGLGPHSNNSPSNRSRKGSQHSRTASFRSRSLRAPLVGTPLWILRGVLASAGSSQAELVARGLLSPDDAAFLYPALGLGSDGGGGAAARGPAGASGRSFRSGSRRALKSTLDIIGVRSLGAISDILQRFIVAVEAEEAARHGGRRRPVALFLEARPPLSFKKL
eukprot:tig00021571_g22358.t1